MVGAYVNLKQKAGTRHRC